MQRTDTGNTYAASRLYDFTMQFEEIMSVASHLDRIFTIVESRKYN